MISFFVPGIPRSTQTGTVVRVKGRLFPLRRNTAWSQVIGLVARQYAPPSPIETPVAVSLYFFLPRPKSTRRVSPAVRPDLDNLAKGLTDSLNGVLWKDDAQIISLFLAKSYHPRPGLEVRVERR